MTEQESQIYTTLVIDIQQDQRTQQHTPTTSTDDGPSVPIVNLALFMFSVWMRQRIFKEDLAACPELLEEFYKKHGKKPSPDVHRNILAYIDANPQPKPIQINGFLLGMHISKFATIGTTLKVRYCINPDDQKDRDKCDTPQWWEARYLGYQNSGDIISLTTN
jgi:hypothetical protein